MTDIIGVLGEASAVTVGTHTVYTVPSGKAAKVKIMHRALLANTGTIKFTVNGIDVAEPAAASGADVYFSTSTALNIDNGTVAPLGTTTALTVAPGPPEYYLSAGDTVTYTVGVVALTSISIQVVGSEIDVA